MKKLIALFLILSLLLALAVPVMAADSRAEMQQAVVETARAFHLKGAAMQYDSTPLTDMTRERGGNIRTHNYTTPENATTDRTIYTVCSSFCFEVYYNALGYRLMDRPIMCVTKTLYEMPPEDMVVVRFDGTDEAQRQKSIDALMAAMQPGDLIVTRSHSSTGHAMVYCGDLFGDGKNYIIHSTSSGGGKYNMTTGKDSIEEIGDIRKNEVVQFFLRDGKGQLYTNKTFCLLRPLQSKTMAGCRITDAARTRMQYPGMVIDRTVSCGFYGSAVLGQPLTYTVKITNRSKQDYKALPVKETVPEGTCLTHVDGTPASAQKTLNWTLDIPAGKSKTVTYTVKVEAPLGSTVVNGGGTVGIIPSNTLQTTVGSALPTDKLKNVNDYIRNVQRDLNGDTRLAKSVYLHGLQGRLELPTAADILQNCFTQVQDIAGTHYELRKSPAPGYEDVFQMLVPGYVGGRRYVCSDTHDRLLQLDAGDLEPGDILVTFGESDTQVFVCIGERLIRLHNGTASVTDAQQIITPLFTRQLFFLLRPRLAHAALPQAEALPFTDVRDTDWFYPYVRDLVQEGAVSGITETTYVPGGTLTYGQALKLVALTAGVPEQPAGTHWASGYAAHAKAKGWLTADVNLDAAVSRLQFCQLAAKAMGIGKQPKHNPFTDTENIHVLALLEAGVISGMTETTFCPDAPLTRAQIAKIIWHISQL